MVSTKVNSMKLKSLKRVRTKRRLLDSVTRMGLVIFKGERREWLKSVCNVGGFKASGEVW